MSKPQLILHIIYIHGFRGDHTTFQSFPTDLHMAIQSYIPSHIELRSMLYPTYKSKRPIAVATQNFLRWLEDIPAGPVILCGHSMGGLLAAEAATDPSHTASKRVVAFLAFDVPFLGMHPHVVISGIASLFPSNKADPSKTIDKIAQGRHDGEGLKTEREMNDPRHVDIPWEPRASPNSSTVQLQPSDSSITSTSTISLVPPPLPPRPSSSSQVRAHSLGSRSPSPGSDVLSRTLDFIESHSNNPMVRFFTKHHSDPLTAAKRWIIESFEFGICMFDPKGLRARYAMLQQWPGEWVSFWTESGSESGDENDERGENGSRKEKHTENKVDSVQREREETEALGKLLDPGLDPDSAHNIGKDPKFQEKAMREQQEKELKALRKQHNVHSPHHFVVRPSRSSISHVHKWEKVRISGAKDEVEAHTGLFLPNLNHGYAAFVERVAIIVRGWVDKL